MRNILFVGFLFFCFKPEGVSQASNYSIADFARQDLKRKTSLISSNIRLDGDRDGDNAEYLYGVSGGGFFGNTSFVNSISKQSFSSFRVTLSYSWSGRSKEENQASRFNPALISNVSIKHFYADRSFYEYGYDINSSYSYRNNKSANSDNTNRRFNNVWTIPFYKGHGRIEVVTDAWHSARILETLEDQNLLIRPLSHDTISAFAYKIASIKNARFTDPRHFRINEYEELSSFLTSRNLVDLTDFRLFAQLHDVWEFERFLIRRHGNSFKYGLLSENRYDKSSNNDIQESLLAPGLFASLVYESFQARSLDWQWNQRYSVKAGHRWLDETSDIFENDSDYTQVDLSASYELGYYPSVRTNFTIRGSGFQSMIWEEGERTSDFYYRVAPSFVFYFSPQFTFNIEGLFEIDRDIGFQPNSLIDSRNTLQFRTTYLFY